MSKLIAKLALELLEKTEELMALPNAETLQVLKDHVRLFGFNFALTLSLTKEQ